MAVSKFLSRCFFFSRKQHITTTTKTPRAKSILTDGKLDVFIHFTRELVRPHTYTVFMCVRVCVPVCIRPSLPRHVDILQRRRARACVVG